MNLLLIYLLMGLKMALPASEELTLEVRVLGITEKKGFLMAELKDEKGKIIKQIKQNIGSEGTELSFTGLSKGKYAVAVFHDADANGKLNTNIVGMPTEKYGFSNDARGMFGPPDLQDQLIEVKSGLKTITINLK